MRRFLTVFVILFIIVLGSNITATDFLVSSVLEIDSVLNLVQPGDTITMTRGTWTNADIIFQANGSSSAPILMRAEESGYVLLNGTSTLRIAGDYLIVDGLQFNGGYSISGAVVEFRGNGIYSNYSRLTNTAIINYNPPSSGTDYKWVSLYGINNRVDYCYFWGKNHLGTTLVVWLSAIPNHHLIDHNYFAYRPELGVNGAETIRVGTSDWSMYDSYTVVEYNYFEQCNGEVEIISSKSCENIYRYNTFVECKGALTLRHGNRCTVEGNFFLGNNLPETGGVRVIGEDHKVFNNYFQELRGTGVRSALSLMNGIPNSPLNGYFQVKRAEVSFNTLYNCVKSLVIGLDKDSEKTLPPLDCRLANNLVQSNYTLVTYEDQPINLIWEGNIMYGASLGIPQPPGIKITDPLLLLSGDSLWRPDHLNSPAVDSAKGNYPYVIDDFDGQLRDVFKDVGSDEYSNAPVIRRLLTRGDVGPSWFPLPPEPPTVITVEAGIDSLKNKLSTAQDGYIYELVTDGGMYSNNGNLEINRKITIRAVQGLHSKPILRQTEVSSGARAVIQIGEGGSLKIKGIELDGMATSTTPAKYLICTSDSPMNSSYTLYVEDCYLHDVVLGFDGNFFRAYTGTLADTISFNNCVFKTSGKEGIRLKDEVAGSGLYNVKYFELMNCTFWDVKKEAVYVYAGDTVPFTPGPKVVINHCTFDSCGYDSASIINALETDGTEIKNSIFSNSRNRDFSIQIFGFGSSISYCDTFNVSPVVVNRNALIGSGMLGANPHYNQRFNGDFTLLPDSPLWFQANDGKAMGDLRWAANPPNGITGDRENVPMTYLELSQNYPNPFNGTTVIRYYLKSREQVKLEIYDLHGALIENLFLGFQSPGHHTIRWNPVSLASGIYLYKLSAGEQLAARKMIYIK